MSAPILITKLYIPPPRPKLVLRHRLFARMDEGLYGKLTLVSAPAGFGKTTLVSTWIADLQRKANNLSVEPKDDLDTNLTSNGVYRLAWLALDEGDNDPIRFLTYLVAALQTFEPAIGQGVLDALRASQPPPIESLLTVLLNEIGATLGNPSTGYFDQAQNVSGTRDILVLDDYHVLDAKLLHDALTFLLDHLPPQLHLVITTRENPPLPLARYRARGQLTELRAADLQFTLAETAEFLDQVMGLSLSSADISALENRTEGWIAGLQMAALTMRGSRDTSTFVGAFAGCDRFVFDYLVEEVLQQQPARVRDFLLQTSILKRLRDRLCDAVTERSHSQQMLETLERSNLFVVPLDDRRRWYRYHQLFANALQEHLLKERPGELSALHRRASAWYEQNDLPAEAIQHALAAEDYARAAELIELAWSAARAGNEDGAWLGWVRMLPDALIDERPVLAAGYAWALLTSGELEIGVAKLRDVERWLDAGDGAATGIVVADEEEFRLLPATIATARAFYAQAIGDGPGANQYAAQALELLPEHLHHQRAIASGILGLARWADGDLDAAYDLIAQGLADLRMAGNAVLSISGTTFLADIKVAKGHLHAAISLHKRALRLASPGTKSSGRLTSGGDNPVLPGIAEVHLGLSELYLEQGYREHAQKHLCPRVKN